MNIKPGSKTIHYALILLCLFFTGKLAAQPKNNSPVSLKYEVNAVGDTVLLNVSSDQTKGSLLIVAGIQALNLKDSFYYPLLDTSNLFVLTIPQKLAGEAISVKAFYYPAIFESSGKVLSKKSNKEIDAILITDNKSIYNRPITADENHNFSLPPMVFEDKASLLFYYAGDKKQSHPNIELSVRPTASDFTHLIFDDTLFKEQAIKLNNKRVNAIDTANKILQNNHAGLLQSVTVRAVTKTESEKYNEKNSTGVFNDATEKVIDCLDNSDILSFPDCLSYLRVKIPGLLLNIDKFGGSVMTWRGKTVKAFYIDEIPVDMEQILDFNVNDIAIIKVYPPPFFGAGRKGDGGGIAIYSRKGEYSHPNVGDNKWLFSIKGYSDPVHRLFSGSGY